jgi:sialate O-acetylesterase
MVLQRDRDNSIWGWGEPGQALTISVADHQTNTVVNPEGKWMAPLPSMQANSEGLSITVTQANSETLTINDVLVGEVWLCSGQSNMVWSLANSANGAEAAAAASDPLLRFFQVPTHASSIPMDDRAAAWQHTTPENAPAFTAVGYYFGKGLRENLGVPVGIIRSAYGGTIAEPWISGDTAKTAPALEAYRARIAQMEAENPGLMENFDAEFKRRMQLLEAFNVERARLRAEGVPESDWPPNPGVPSMEPGGRYLTGVLYNAMIAPLVPYGIRGFTWYQGESNTGHFNDVYAETLNTLIEDWRRLWNNPEMPFLVVQLANFHALQEGPVATSTWANVREAQRIVARDNPGVGMVVTIDVGEADDIHPRDKKSVGERLARLARAEVYSEDGLLPGGPELAESYPTPEGVLLRFENAADGLRLFEGSAVQGITIQAEGAEPVFAPAQIVSDNSIFVRAPEATGKVLVRHAWADNPIRNVVNSEGLPMGPFEVSVEMK